MRNPFPSPSPLERVLLRELAQCARVCYEHGWAHGRAGNFSLRGRDGIVWQSPSDVPKDKLTAETFIPVDIHTAKPVWPDAARPSGETPIHLGIYRAVPAAVSVVHGHLPHFVSLSRAGEDLLFQGDEMQKHLGSHEHHETLRIPVIANPARPGLPAMISDLGRHLRPGVPVVALAGHGVYAWGRTPADALNHLEALEFLCRTRNAN